MCVCVFDNPGYLNSPYSVWSFLYVYIPRPSFELVPNHSHAYNTVQCVRVRVRVCVCVHTFITYNLTYHITDWYFQ